MKLVSSIPRNVLREGLSYKFTTGRHKIQSVAMELDVKKGASVPLATLERAYGTGSRY